MIAVAWSESAPLGVAATLAVVLHEIPHEMGDLGVLLAAGLSRRQAVLLNMLPGSSADIDRNTV